MVQAVIAYINNSLFARVPTNLEEHHRKQYGPQGLQRVDQVSL